MTALLLFVMFSCVMNYVHSARILAVFPTPSISHQFFYQPLTHELVRRGHEVTVITTDPAFSKGEAPSNLKEIDVHDLSYDIWKEHFLTAESGKESSFLKKMEAAYKALSGIIKSQIMTKEIQEIFLKKNGDFDALLLEAICYICLYFSYIFKIPVIQIGSLGRSYSNFNVFGASTYPLLYPSRFSKKSHNFSIWEVVEQIHKDYLIKQYSENTEELGEILPEIFKTEIPTSSELENNINILLLNMHPLWINNQPLPPNIVQIGGLHKPRPKKISKELQAFLDSSKNGIIYFSLGTNVIPSLISKDKIQMFITVFAKLPYDVLWKWDQDFLEEKSENIRIFKWLPQAEVLKHQNVKLFITQGGLQSTDEAIAAGVPLIGIPMLSDQWYNVGNYVHHKIGEKLDLESLTEEQLQNAIENVITNKRYRKNIVRLRTIMEDQPQPALHRAVWWTEHVLQQGNAKHLRAAITNITWAEYFEVNETKAINFRSATIKVFLNNIKFRENNYFLLFVHEKGMVRLLSECLLTKYCPAMQSLGKTKYI